MDLEQLKSNWTEHNALLKRNLEVNEEVLKTMKLNNAKTSIKLSYNLEGSMLIFSLIFTVYLIFKLSTLINETLHLLSGISFILFAIMGTWSTFVKMRTIQSINFYSPSIIQVQQQLEKMKKKFIVLRIWEMYMTPFLILGIPGVAIMLLGKAIFELNEYEIYVRGAIGLTLGMIISYFIHKQVHLKNLKAAQNRINEIETFQNETE